MKSKKLHCDMTLSLISAMQIKMVDIQSLSRSDNSINE
jgi:hypothetical protein